MEGREYSGREVRQKNERIAQQDRKDKTCKSRRGTTGICGGFARSKMIAGSVCPCN